MRQWTGKMHWPLASKNSPHALIYGQQVNLFGQSDVSASTVTMLTERDSHIVPRSEEIQIQISFSKSIWLPSSDHGTLDTL